MNHPSQEVTNRYNYEEICRRICIQVVNYEHYRKELQSLAHIRWEDLAILFVYEGDLQETKMQGAEDMGENSAASAGNADCTDRLSEHEEKRKENERASGSEDDLGKRRINKTTLEMSITVPLRKTTLAEWGVDEYSLLRSALLNSRELHPMYCRTMQEILEIPEGLDGGMGPEIYVMTCREAGYGAATMFYPGVLAEMAKRLGGDFYLIPSSVHELLALRMELLDDPDGLREIIRSVNREAVLPGDFLSNSLYGYRVRRGELEKL